MGVEQTPDPSIPHTLVGSQLPWGLAILKNAHIDSKRMFLRNLENVQTVNLVSLGLFVRWCFFAWCSGGRSRGCGVFLTFARSGLKKLHFSVPDVGQRNVKKLKRDGVVLAK